MLKFFFFWLLLVKPSSQSAFIRAIVFKQRVEDEHGVMVITSTMQDNLGFALRLARQAVKDCWESERVQRWVRIFYTEDSVESLGSGKSQKVKNILEQVLPSENVNSGKLKVLAPLVKPSVSESQISCPQLEAEYDRLFNENLLHKISALLYDAQEVQDFSKVDSQFSNGLVLSYPQRVAAEVVLIDLFADFWPQVDLQALESFEDFCGLMLVHLFTGENFSLKLLSLLSKVCGRLEMPSLEEYQKDLCSADRHCFLLFYLFVQACKLDLKCTLLALLTCKIVDLRKDTTVRLVVDCATPKMARLCFDRLDRNCKLDWEPLAHVIFYAKRFDLLEVLLEFMDVDWNATDYFGFTILGLFMNQEGGEFDKHFKKFVCRMAGFNLCYNDGQLKRCVLEEALALNRPLAMKRYKFFIRARSEDAFDPLIITAASLLRIDLFRELVRLRLSCFHELDVVFQAVFYFLKLDEPVYERYLAMMIRLIERSDYHYLKQIFLMKWKYQLALYQSSK